MARTPKIFDPAQVRPCQGPCGRMTRPTSWNKEEIPEEYKDTIARATALLCSTCHKKDPEVLARRLEPKPETVLTQKDLDNIAQAQAFAKARQERLARQGAGKRLRTARPIMAGRG